MAGEASLKMIGDWRKEVGVPLRDALAVSMDVIGRTGEEACRHALILMAQSAAAITRVARKNRKVEQDPRVRGIGGQYVEVYTQGETRPKKLHRLQYLRGDADRENLGTWEQAKAISPGRRGLAKRSWLWGLNRLGMSSAGRAIPGTSRVFSVKSERTNGYIKEDSLSYIHKAIPANWAQQVELRAGNKIMAQARLKLERQWRSRMRRRERAVNRGVESFFKTVSA